VIALALAAGSEAAPLRPGDLIVTTQTVSAFDVNSAVNPVAVYPSEGILRLDPASSVQEILASGDLIAWALSRVRLAPNGDLIASSGAGFVRVDARSSEHR